MERAKSFNLSHPEDQAKFLYQIFEWYHGQGYKVDPDELMRIARLADPHFLLTDDTVSITENRKVFSLLIKTYAL